MRKIHRLLYHPRNSLLLKGSETSSRLSSTCPRIVTAKDLSKPNLLFNSLLRNPGEVEGSKLQSGVSTSSPLRSTSTGGVKYHSWCQTSEPTGDVRLERNGCLESESMKGDWHKSQE